MKLHLSATGFFISQIGCGSPLSLIFLIIRFPYFVNIPFSDGLPPWMRTLGLSFFLPGRHLSFSMLSNKARRCSWWLMALVASCLVIRREFQGEGTITTGEFWGEDWSLGFTEDDLGDMVVEEDSELGDMVVEEEFLETYIVVEEEFLETSSGGYALWHERHKRSFQSVLLHRVFPAHLEHWRAFFPIHLFDIVLLWTIIEDWCNLVVGDTQSQLRNIVLAIKLYFLNWIRKLEKYKRPEVE